METRSGDTPVVARVRELVVPIASDLGLDLYDIEQRGGTLRVALDTPAGSAGGITMDILALATRLVSRELDHHDPIPGHYTLEVTSPGLERPLRTPEHFRREIGKVVAVRLSDVSHDERRMRGELLAADDTGITVRTDDPPAEHHIDYVQIDRARTVFEWPVPSAKPGAGTKRQPAVKPKKHKKEIS